MGKHYVPQKYLAGFAKPNDPGQVWMYDKRERNWSRAAISRVAQERDYFDSDTESQLAVAVEAPVHGMLDRLRRFEAITPEEREALALYAAVMLMRVPRRRRKASELVEPTLREVVDRLRDQMRAEATSPEDEPRLQMHLKNLDRVQQELAATPPDSVIANIRSPWPSENVLSAVTNMAWRFVTSSGPSYFLTSDNPAYFFEAYGVGSPEAELTFPLASEVALLGSWQGERRSTSYLVAQQALVKEVNRRVASGAERFVFYRQHAPWIATLAHRRNPYLSRIRWE